MIYINRLSIEFVREQFLKRNYILLEDNYINNSNKMRYICPFHPDKELSICYDKLMIGRGCKYCWEERRKSVKLLNFDVVNQSFIDRGYTLIDSEYLGAKYKMRYQCPHHPDKELSISYNNLQMGRGCPHCAIDRNTGENNSNWKGGIRNLNVYLRDQLSEWVRETLFSDNFTCFISGQRGGKLEVHHTVPFHKVRDLMLKELNYPIKKETNQYSESQLSNMSYLFKELHKNIKGVPLEKQIHKEFHRIYGRDSVTTFENLLEFKKYYSNLIG